MRARIEVTVDGTQVAGAFYERLTSITVTDKEGSSADTVSIELNDGPPNFLAIPRKGAIIDVRLGYAALRSIGKFTVDKISCKCLPYSMSISGKSADLRSGKLKENKERHWDKKKLKDIVSQVAAESGLESSIDSDIGDYEYEWLGQQDEPNIQFLERLAKRHNALFSVKNGKVVFAARGSGLSAGGTFVGSIIITPANIIQGTCTFDSNDRTKYSKVVAYHQDGNKAERVEISADADADGDSVYRIEEPFATIAEADKAAKSKAKGLKRGKGSAAVTVPGDTSIIAGSPLLFNGVRPGFDGVPYVIHTATHTYTKRAGYLTAISAKLYDGKSGAKTNSTGGASAANDNAPEDKTAPNSAAGTPATPAQWLTPRNGSTDSN